MKKKSDFHHVKDNRKFFIFRQETQKNSHKRFSKFFLSENLDLSMFDDETNQLMEDLGLTGSNETYDFDVTHTFQIPNFLDSNGPFESITLPVGPFNFKATATKNTGSVPFLDFKINLINPPESPLKITISITINNKEKSEETVLVKSNSTLSKNFAVMYFSNFISLRALKETPGFITDGTLIANIKFSSSNTESNIWGTATSRESTGYVGLENQGATCYMNSMLQMLYHLPAFRQIVYDLPTAEIEDPERSIPLQLQMLFYNLEFSSQAVSTKDLTKSFGWKPQDIMVQHDVQEFNRILMSTLEEKLKGTESEKKISSLFTGKNQNAIRCVNIDYESFTETPFTDLQLHVQGNRTLDEAFEGYLAVDRLEGSNQYNVPGHGKQDADICMEITELPTVLQLHLNRFTYDFDRDQIVKINDWFEYPESIDLSKYVTKKQENKKSDKKAKSDEDISKSDKEEVKSDSQIYDLVGVLVHSGTNYSGHYYAYIKPEIDGDWYEFNDSVVRKAKKDEVFKANFGQNDEDDEEDEPKQKVLPKQRFSKRNFRTKNMFDKNRNKRKPVKRRRTVDHSAYLLIYVNRDKQKDVYLNERKVPHHLEVIFEKLKKEKELKQKQLLQQIYETDVQILTDSDISDNETKYFSVKDVKNKIHVNLQQPLEKLYETVKEVYKLDSFTLWQCGAYGNPTRIIEKSSEGAVGKFLSGTSTIYIQKTEVSDISDHILTFVKSFDGLTVNFEGSQIIEKTKTVNDLFTKPFSKAFIEEYGGHAVEISPETVLTANIIHQGMIFVFQNTKETQTSELSKICGLFDLSNYQNYLEMKFNSFELKVKSKSDSEIKSTQVPMNMSIPDMKQVISHKFNLDYDKEKDTLLIFEKEEIPLKLKRKTNIEFLKNSNGIEFELIKDINENEEILYQRIEISQNSFEISQKFVKILKINTAIHSIYEMLKKENVLDHEMNEYRYFTVWGTSIWELLKENNTLNDDSLVLRIDLVPEDQKQLLEEEFLVPLSHPDCEEFRPTLFKVKEGGTAKEMKEKLKSIYKVDDVSKWHLDAVTTLAGKSKNVTLKNDDTLDAYLKTKSLELHVYHSLEKQTNTRNHVALKIL